MNLVWSPLPSWHRLGAKAGALLLLAGVAAPHSAASPAATVAAAPADTAASLHVAAFGRRPPAFEANRGQADARVRFLSRAGGYVLFLTPSEAVLALEGGDGAGVSYVRTRFAGASPSARVSGFGEQPGAINYLRGGRAPVLGVERYSGVRYESIYPGIDLLYYATEAGLEYDFVVSPGADPSAISLDVAGAERVGVTGDGDLAISTRSGELRQRRPVAFQELGGERRAVTARFAVSEGGRVGFEVGGYDPALPLVIDPVLVYSTYLGGTNPDRGNAIAVDAAGNSYVAGRAFSPDFPIAGAFQAENAGNYDVFVTKLAPTGASLVYSTYIGGFAFDSAEAIAINAAGQAFVGGYTGSTDFPTVAAFQPEFGGGTDAFVARLSASGNALVYSSFHGGSMPEFGYGIAVDGSDNAFLVGDTASVDMPVAAAIQPDYGGGQRDAFFAKVLPSGALANSSYLGGISEDSARAAAVDSGGNLYITGYTGFGFPLVIPFQTSAGGVSSAFVTKVAASMANYAYSSLLGGSGEDQGSGIAVDPSGNAYVTGYTHSTNFPVVTPFQAVNRGISDAFFTKVNVAGTAIVFSSYLGGTREEVGHDVAVDSFGSVYLVGQTRSSNFPVAVPIQPVKGGNILNDAFVTKVAASGRILVYSTYLGGASTDVGYGIDVDPGGSAYVTGYTDSSNFPTVGPFQAESAGVDDAFVAKILERGDTPGIVFQGSSPPAWFLRNASAPGPADVSFTYGPQSSWVPLAGDWNGDGLDTPGLYDPATGAFFLRNANSNGAANVVFVFGGPNLVPIAGDWNGDGIDTVGVYVPSTSTFFLKNTNANGPADVAFVFGAPGLGYVPLAGDWNGDGVDTIGLYTPVTGDWFLRNSNTAGPADVVFNFGPTGADVIPVVGDWNADGIDTIGIYARLTGAWFVRNTNTSGVADLAFFYGGTLGMPIAGDWDR